jgi:hypothetical protein
MTFDSDASYVPDTTNYGIFFLLRAGASADWIRLWSLLDEDSDDIIGARLFVGVRDFDNRWQPTNAITWLLRAYAGRPRSTGRGGDDNITYTMSLPWQTDFYDRNQAFLAYWSAVAQRRRYPGDTFFDEVIRMAQGMVIKWMI